jgi:predicted amidohydrolase
MARTARIALLQLRAFDVEDAEVSLRHTLDMIDEAARARPDVIVMPEMTYPAYFLGRADLAVPGVRPASEVAGLFAAKAREHGVYIAAGMALGAAEFRAAGGVAAECAAGFVNAAMLFGRDGGIAGRYAKSFLWHFDQRWFAPGDAYPVFDTDAGRIGMLVCADGRMPEIARSLAVGGAQIILDLTAWVSGARREQDLTSAQRAYLMQTRALENGVWIAAADKVGVEAQSIVYCGGSCVIDPNGRYVAQLGPTGEGILVHDVPVEDARPPVARRPELYAALAIPTEELPAERVRGEALVPADEDRSVAVVQMRVPGDPDAFLDAARRHARRLAIQGARLVLFPPPPPGSGHAAERIVPAMSAIAAATGMFLAFVAESGAAGGTMYLAGPQGMVLEHAQTHAAPGMSIELGDGPCDVADTDVCRIGLMLGDEGLVPEVARSLMLRGAELILWAHGDPGAPMALVARTRADENRLYLACAAPPAEHAATMVAAPSGGVLVEALEATELAVAATVNRTLARLKERAPGTDVVRARRPETYAAIAVASRDAAARVV